MGTTAVTAISGSQLIAAFCIGIALLIFLVLATKIHAFLALIASGIVIGLIAGLSTDATVNAITGGFGGTLSSIGIIIGFGVMMGQLFEVTGAAERMARTFLKLFGKGNEEWALAATGYIVSIPIFCDSGFVILVSLAKALAKESKKSIVALGICLAGGLVTTHVLVPPTPGPLGVAGTFGVDLGKFILIAMALSVPIVIAVAIYGMWLGKRIYQLPADDNENWVRPPYQQPTYVEHNAQADRNLPSTFASFAPLLAPIFLILFNTVLKALGLTTGFYSTLIFLGTPVVAVGIGLILAIFLLAGGLDRQKVLTEMEKGMKSAGIILLVTGGGGALGRVLQTSGIGDYIAKGLAQSSVPLFLLPFIIATLVRFAQGSGTVAMITAAGICAPIVQAGGGNLMLGAFAACMGSFFFSYFNDSFFWVTNRLMGISDTKEQIRVWSISTTIAWAVGFLELLVLNMIWK